MKKIILISLILIGLFFGLRIFAVELNKDSFVKNEPILLTACIGEASYLTLFDLTTDELVGYLEGICQENIGQDIRDFFAQPPIWSENTHTFSLLEDSYQACQLTYEECKAEGTFLDEEIFSITTPPFIDISVDFVTSTLAYVKAFIGSGISPLLAMIIGLPLAFWVIWEVIDLVPKRKTKKE